MKNLIRERRIPVYVDFNGKLEQLSLKEAAEIFFSNKLLYKEDRNQLLFADILETIGVFRKDPDDKDVKKRAIYLALLVKDSVPSNNMLNAIGIYALIKI